MPTHRSLIIAATLLSLSVYAPAARAAWSAPVTVSSAHAQIHDLQLVSGANGELLAWRYWDQLPGRGIFGAAHARDAVAAPGAPFGPERPLPAAYASAPLVNLGGGRVAQLILRDTGLNTSRPEVALGNVSGRFLAPLPVPGASTFAGRATLAGNARGELLLTWIAADAHGAHRVVWASSREPHGHFGRPQLISRRADAEQVNAAVGAQGDLVVAFPDKRGHLLVRVRRHHQRWGAPQRVGAAAGGTENDVTPFVAADGRIVVAWYETQLCSGGCESPGFVRIAVQPTGSARFRREQVLERDPIGLAGAPSGVSLAPIVLTIGRHAPIVIFLAAGARPPGTGPTPSTIVKVAYARGLGFAAARTISPVDTLISGVAAGSSPNGAIVTWIRGAPPGFDTGSVFAAALTPTAGAFGQPQQVSPEEHVLSALPTFNAGGRTQLDSLGPWTVAWTSRPVSDALTVVRVSSAQCPSPSLLSAADAVPAPTSDPSCFGA